jgi:hypothetical protein
MASNSKAQRRARPGTITAGKPIGSNDLLIAASSAGQAAAGLFTVSILSRTLPRSRFAI